MSGRIVTGEVRELPSGTWILGIEDRTCQAIPTRWDNIFQIKYNDKDYWAYTNPYTELPVILIPVRLKFDEGDESKIFEVTFNFRKKRFQVKYQNIIYYFNLETGKLESNKIKTPPQLPPLEYFPRAIVFSES